MVLLVLTLAIEAETSLGTTSPRYIMHTAMYLPCLGSHLASMVLCSNTAEVSSGTESFS